MGNTDSVVAQKRLARFRPDERPVIEGIFDKLHGTGSSVSHIPKFTTYSKYFLMEGMTMGKMASESMIKRVFQGIHSIDPRVPLPPGDGISCEQLVIFLADILRGTAEERAPLVLAMAEGAKATATTTEQIRGFVEDLVSAAVQTLAHRGHLRAWQPDRMGNGPQGVKLLAQQLTSELKSSDQNTCDIPCLEDWMFRIPAMAMFLELLIGEGLGVGLPSCLPPTLLPPCQYAPWNELLEFSLELSLEYTSFDVDTVEMWGIGQPPEEQEEDEKKKSILDVDSEAQAMMAMTGKTLYSQILREPEEDEEQ